MESPATWTLAEWVVREAINKAEKARAEGRIGLSMARQITDALREAGLLAPGPELGVFSPPEVHSYCGYTNEVGTHGGPDDRHCVVCVEPTCRFNQPDKPLFDHLKEQS